MSRIASYAGDEAGVRSQVEAAMAESRPLPEWRTTEAPPKPATREVNERLDLTSKLHLSADSYHGDGHWYTSLYASLGDWNGERTLEARLRLLRAALAEMDAARPVLARLIESAEAAGITGPAVEEMPY